MNNISWQAIDYPGADPQFDAKQQSEASNLKENGRSIEVDEDEEELYGPLFKAIVNLEHQQAAATALRKFGFPVTLLSPMTKTSSPSMIIKCDAVVVGSGSGGGVVAGVLANAGYKVLVLEKGSYCARANISLLEGQAMEEMYLSSGLVATDNMSVLVLAGSTVGGGSTVNWSASIQTPSHVTREWSDEYELELFSSSLYKEALEVVCKKMGVQSEIDNEGFNNALLRKGCEELGYQAFNIPRNSTSDHYCGWCCLGCKDGRKKGTAETWLVDLVRTGNGAILTGCEAISIRKEKKHGSERNSAKGIAFEFGCGSGAKQMCLVESKVTIVACGALSTPPLLKRSGLKNPNIGKNLHLHPVTMAWGHFPAETGRAIFFSDRQAAMEKPPRSFAISFSIVAVAVLTVTSFASCMAAEFNRTKKKDLELNGRFCFLPESEAFKLGAVGLVCLIVAQIFGNAVICHGCWGEENRKSCSVKATILFISWVSFGFTMVLMSGATSMSRRQEYKKGWMEGECYMVKDGVFVGAALLALVNGGFTIGSIAIERQSHLR